MARMNKAIIILNFIEKINCFEENKKAKYCRNN